MSKRSDAFLTSIDPGLNTTAWAVWFDGRLLTTGMVHSKQKQPLLQRCQHIARTVSRHVHDDGQVAIEYPAFMPGSAGGVMVAARGDLVKLTMLVGYLSCYLRESPVQLVPVHKWKGQLPKRIVERRIRAVLQSKLVRGLQKDEWDAVGIGLYVLRGADWFNG